MCKMIEGRNNPVDFLETGFSRFNTMQVHSSKCSIECISLLHSFTGRVYPFVCSASQKPEYCGHFHSILSYILQSPPQEFFLGLVARAGRDSVHVMDLSLISLPHICSSPFFPTCTLVLFQRFFSKIWNIVLFVCAGKAQSGKPTERLPDANDYLGMSCAGRYITIWIMSYQQ